MFKRSLLFIAIIIILVTCLTGCLNRKIKLDYIQMPDKITIQGYENRDQMDKLNIQLKELKTKHASMEEQQKVLDKIGALANESMLEVKDKDFMNKVVGQIQNLEGTIECTITTLPKGKVVFGMQFNYEKAKQTTVKVNDDTVVAKVADNTLDGFNQGYITNINIFSDGTIFAPKYDKSAPSNIVMIKAKLDQETIKYITDYYNSKKGN